MKLVCLDTEGNEYTYTVAVDGAFCGHKVIEVRLDEKDTAYMAHMLTSKTGTQRLAGCLVRLHLRFGHLG